METKTSKEKLHEINEERLHQAGMKTAMVEMEAKIFEMKLWSLAKFIRIAQANDVICQYTLMDVLIEMLEGRLGGFITDEEKSKLSINHWRSRISLKTTKSA